MYYIFFVWFKSVIDKFQKVDRHFQAATRPDCSVEYKNKHVCNARHFQGVRKSFCWKLSNLFFQSLRNGFATEGKGLVKQKEKVASISTGYLKQERVIEFKLKLMYI